MLGKRWQCVAMVSAMWLAAAGASAKDSATDIVRKAAAVIAAQHKAHPHYSYRMARADLYARGKDSVEERYETHVYMTGDKAERIEYLAGTQGGRALTDAELKRIGERADDARKRQAGFRAPYDASTLADYDYQSAGEETVSNRRCYRVQFRARVEDSQHASGSMWVDTRSFNVVKLSYEFARNPAGVERSLVEVYRAPAIGELWSPVRTYRKLDRGERGTEESAFVNTDFREP